MIGQCREFEERDNYFKEQNAITSSGFTTKEVEELRSLTRPLYATDDGRHNSYRNSARIPLVVCLLLQVNHAMRGSGSRGSGRGSAVGGTRRKRQRQTEHAATRGLYPPTIQVKETNILPVSHQSNQREAHLPSSLWSVVCLACLLMFM